MRSITQRAARSSSAASPSPVEIDGMRSQSVSSSSRFKRPTLRFVAMGWSPPDLSGRVAVVTGATRGVGRGIALVLGECGATVHVTGRSRVEAVAAEVTERGGRGIAAPTGPTHDAQGGAPFAGPDPPHPLRPHAGGGH